MSKRHRQLKRRRHDMGRPVRILSRTVKRHDELDMDYIETVYVDHRGRVATGMEFIELTHGVARGDSRAMLRITETV